MFLFFWVIGIAKFAAYLASRCRNTAEQKAKKISLRENDTESVEWKKARKQLF